MKVESKQQGSYKSKTAFGVMFHIQRALPLLPWCGCLWDSLGPAVMESCKEGAGVAYWKKANELRSTLGQAESLGRAL